MRAPTTETITIRITHDLSDQRVVDLLASHLFDIKRPTLRASEYDAKSRTVAALRERVTYIHPEAPIGTDNAREDEREWSACLAIARRAARQHFDLNV